MALTEACGDRLNYTLSHHADIYKMEKTDISVTRHELPDIPIIDHRSWLQQITWRWTLMCMWMAC